MRIFIAKPTRNKTQNHAKKFLTLKVNLHFHSGEDPRDFIPYSFYEGIDCAVQKGFDALALTCHQKFVFKEEFKEYAAKKGILAIPGIELSLDKGKHVVVLNCRKDIEKVSTLESLRKYKKNNPGIFVLAPHPFFTAILSLRGLLIKNIDLFDAIEFSWLWMRNKDRNKKAKLIAEKYNKPYIATSDTHYLQYLDRSCAMVEAKENTIASIFEAIKNFKFTNFSLPLKRKEFLKAEILMARVYMRGRLRDFKNHITKK